MTNVHLKVGRDWYRNRDWDWAWRAVKTIVRWRWVGVVCDEFFEEIKLPK